MITITGSELLADRAEWTTKLLVHAFATLAGRQRVSDYRDLCTCRRGGVISSETPGSGAAVEKQYL